MKLLRLLSYFMSGCTATTWLGWLTSFTPQFGLLLVYFIAGLLLAIVIALTFDDPIAEYLGISLATYYGAIGGAFTSTLCGLIVLGGILWL